MSSKKGVGPTKVGDVETGLSTSLHGQTGSFSGYQSTPLDETNTSAPPRDFSTRDLNIELVNKSLSDVNNFSTARRPNEKQSTIMMYEITTDGESDYKEMTLRELLNYVNKESAAIDERAETIRHERFLAYQAAKNFGLSEADVPGSPLATPLAARRGLHPQDPQHAPNLDRQESYYNIDTAYPAEEVPLNAQH